MLVGGTDGLQKEFNILLVPVLLYFIFVFIENASNCLKLKKKLNVLRTSSLQISKLTNLNTCTTNALEIV